VFEADRLFVEAAYSFEGLPGDQGRRGQHVRVFPDALAHRELWMRATPRIIEHHGRRHAAVAVGEIKVAIDPVVERDDGDDRKIGHRSPPQPATTRARPKETDRGADRQVPHDQERAWRCVAMGPMALVTDDLAARDRRPVSRPNAADKRLPRLFTGYSSARSLCHCFLRMVGGRGKGLRPRCNSFIPVMLIPTSCLNASTERGDHQTSTPCHRPSGDTISRTSRSAWRPSIFLGV
jgi:hypothetical protein